MPLLDSLSDYPTPYAVKFSRFKIEDYAKCKRELLDDLAEFRANEKLVQELSKTIEELNREKEEHSEIIQAINQVVVLLFFNEISAEFQDKTELEREVTAARGEQREIECRLAQKLEQLEKQREICNEKIKDTGIGEDGLLAADDAALADLPKLTSPTSVLTSPAGLFPGLRGLNPAALLNPMMFDPSMFGVGNAPVRLGQGGETISEADCGRLDRKSGGLDYPGPWAINRLKTVPELLKLFPGRDSPFSSIFYPLGPF